MQTFAVTAATPRAFENREVPERASREGLDFECFELLLTPQYERDDLRLRPVGDAIQQNSAGA